jgi:putative hydrolase of the HAD superfamily
MPDPIKNIIFDFGGVIFNIDHLKLENAYRKLGMDNFDLLFNQAAQADVFRQFETGEITPEEFRYALKKITGLQLTDKLFDQTWNEILCDYPPHRIELLKSIQSNYRLYLLSNTNSIHYRRYISMFRNAFGYDFHDLFDEAFWSFKIGKRKPDPDPYLHILEKHRLNPGETLFIDDSIQNIVAAEKLDILAFHLKSGTDISDLFENGLLRPVMLQNLKR